MVFTKKELWVLTTINHYSNKETGITLEEVLSHDKRKINLEQIGLLIIVKAIGEKGLVKLESRRGSLNPIIFITKKGKSELNKSLKKLGSFDFFDFLHTAPEAILNNYRLYNLERALLLGVLGFLLFQVSLFGIRNQYFLGSLIILFFGVFFMGLSIGFIVNISGIIFYPISKSLDKKWAKLKIGKGFSVGFILKFKKIVKILGWICFYIIIPSIIVYFIIYPIFMEDIKQARFWIAGSLAILISSTVSKEYKKKFLYWITNSNP